MKFLNNISVRSRLSLILVLVTLVSSLVIGILGWTNGRGALERTITNQMTSIRAAQSYHLEDHFQQVFSHTRTLARDRMLVNAMKQFRAGYNIGLHRSLSAEQTEKVGEFYNQTLGDALAANYEEPPLPFMYRPRRAVANYFQYHYIVENSYPLGQKDLFMESKNDNTIYSRFHKFYHPIFRGLLKEFEYYDVFLVDIKSLTIIYSVFKEIDFATSLRDGPHQDSGLGILVKQIAEQPRNGEVRIVDFSPYIPSYGSPAAFVGAPIYDGNQAVGILAIQLSAQEINRTMTYDRNWQRNGLGTTGESYIVGADRTMRSDSRLLLEDKTSFLKALSSTDFLPSTVAQIDRLETTNKLVPVISSSIDRAFAGEEGTHTSRNYLGQPVLSSFSSLNIPGLNWVIVSEMGAAEAFSPITNMQRNILIWGTVLILITALLSMLLSRIFVDPIQKLADGVSRLREGDDEFQVDIKSRDEFGALASNFNAMVTNIREKSDALKSKDKENHDLLLNIMPAPIAERVKAGEQVIDNFQQVSVAFIHIGGFSELADVVGAAKSAAYIQTIFDQLDNSGASFDVERIKVIGTTYIVGCGLSHPRLDHTRQIMSFSLATQKLIARFNLENNTELSLQVGIDSGPVVVAVVGQRQLSYQVWGRTVDIARQAYLKAERSEIVVTDFVKQKLEDDYRTTSNGTIAYNGEPVPLHRVEAVEGS